MKVRGVCAAGHVTEATAAPKRVTWHGPCATAGCDLKVYCRRVPIDRAPPAAGPAGEPAGDANDPHRVIRIDRYDSTDDGPAGLAVDTADPIPGDAGPEPAGGDGAGADDDGPADPIDADDDGPGRRLGRRFGSGRSRGRRPAGEFRHPLGIG